MRPHRMLSGMIQSYFGRPVRACASRQGRPSFFFNQVFISGVGSSGRFQLSVRESIFSRTPEPLEGVLVPVSLDAIVIVIRWARSSAHKLSHAYDRSVDLSSRLLLISSLGFPQTKRPNPNIIPYLAPSFAPPPLSPSVLVDVTFSIRRQYLHVAGAFYATHNPHLYYIYHGNSKTMLCGDCAATARPMNKLVVSF
jgi:hypothetical protein